MVAACPKNALAVLARSFIDKKAMSSLQNRTMANQNDGAT
jgi:hypothetical protein